ncbi:Rieske (2Fe-2S) protein [Ammoniphilus sp. YIM 78166]|uniref:Rieske (2Fe-2S) protein n=1 Tax=Ammoniphilus sp. YIM 78166 TaxID=1644106 RepID=UPI00106F7A23|nr:Rieske (2Fe-2S) protein [Ammoniphilus sp. YIM 78166]
MKEYIVATVEEIPTGEKKHVKIEGRSICIFNVNGDYFALRNSCPHQGAPLCEGSVGGMTVCESTSQGSLDQLVFIKEGEILRCPWHGWEFDIKTGKSINDPQRCLVKTYDVKVQSPPETLQAETYPVIIRSDYVIVTI